MTRPPGSALEPFAGMRRASAPVEILLGFFCGGLAGLAIGQPFLWVLHVVGLTSQAAFSTTQTLPLGVEAFWSRVSWDGFFGLLLAWFGTRYELGTRWAVSGGTAVVAMRTLIDWLALPLLWGHPWADAGVGWFLTPLLLNIVVTAVTLLLLAGATVAIGTWGGRAVT